MHKLRPLDVFGLRRVEVLPEHFKYAIYKYKEHNLEPSEVNDIVKWCEENTFGRYYVDYNLEAVKIGFEEPKELTLFSLSYK